MILGKSKILLSAADYYNGALFRMLNGPTVSDFLLGLNVYYSAYHETYKRIIPEEIRYFYRFLTVVEAAFRGKTIRAEKLFPELIIENSALYVELQDEEVMKFVDEEISSAPENLSEFIHEILKEYNVYPFLKSDAELFRLLGQMRDWS